MTENRFLTYDAEEGTEVEVQSVQIPENFHTGYIDEDGRVRIDENDAYYNAENYVVIGEK